MFKKFNQFINESNSKWSYTDKHIHGRNVTKLVRAAGEQGYSKYIKRLSDKEVIITMPNNTREENELYDIIYFAIGGLDNLVEL
jgi:hypothetical protein